MDTNFLLLHAVMGTNSISLDELSFFWFVLVFLINLCKLFSYFASIGFDDTCELTLLCLTSVLSSKLSHLLFCGLKQVGLVFARQVKSGWLWSLEYFVIF